MANKREFKKYVDELSSSLYNEMMINYYNVENIDKEQISKAITKVLGAMETARMNSNTFFDKGVKAFDNKAEYGKAKKIFFKKLFKKIISDYSAEIEDALKSFNAAIPADTKEKNKEFA